MGATFVVLVKIYTVILAYDFEIVFFYMLYILRLCTIIKSDRRSLFGVCHVGWEGSIFCWVSSKEGQMSGIVLDIGYLMIKLVIEFELFPKD